jgi:transposase
MASYQHREQIAFDALDTATGEVSRGRIRPADRLGFRRWLGRWEGKRIEAALEATTGWRFMVEELQGVGAEVHLAEPAETSALRGPKKRAKTDRQDARRLRELLIAFVGVLVSIFLVRGRDLRLPKPVVAEPALEEAA